jgi:glycosyltransferase involved in cell wall biosynthesis
VDGRGILLESIGGQKQLTTLPIAAKRPRVLQLFTSLSLGGMERQTLQLVRLLQERGCYEVLVASLSPTVALRVELERLGHCDFPVYQLLVFRNPKAALQVIRFARFLQRHAITILHTHDFYTNTFGMAAGMLARVPMRVCSRRELDVFTRQQRRVEHVAYRASHCVAANCDFLREQLIREGLPRERIRVLPNGIDPARALGSREETRSSLLNWLGLSPEAQVVSMVANLHNARKDHATFVRAADRLRREFPSAVFVVAGNGEPGEALRADGQSLLEQRRLLFLGSCQRIADLLLVSDICVLSSHSEGLSNAVLEYMAAARPVVASDVGGIRELVVEDRTGYLVSPRDPSRLADRIAFLLRHPERANLMGEAGRARVYERFSLTGQSDAVHRIYAELLGRV